MEIFSEIYSCYYNVVNKILNKCDNEPLSKGEISDIINEKAFSESAFYILPKLASGEWNLFEVNGDLYLSKLSSKVKRPLTILEKSWLKAVLSDKRIDLFIKDEQIGCLNDFLQEVEPLFHLEDFYYYDCFADGDPYEDRNYIRNFRAVLAAVKSKSIINITFQNKKNTLIAGDFIAAKIEYSNKDDKFRLYALKVRYGKVVANLIINIARIVSVDTSSEVLADNIDIKDYPLHSKCKEPVVIEISKERNAVERCMLHFASYEKRTEYDETNDKYISYIYYDKKDETELLIRILSFGPVIKVLGPEVFLKQIKERVKKQKYLYSSQLGE